MFTTSGIAQRLASTLAEIESVFDTAGTEDEREALAQHYGLPTRWLDVVDNIQTAAWFAYHSDGKDSGRADDSVGYIYAFAYPTKANKYVRVYDLRLKPSEWLRPHIQQAWSVRATNPEIGLGKLWYLQVATFIVPRSLLSSWCGFGVFAPEVMFPNKVEDEGASYWSRAESLLVAKGLYPPPWKRIP